MSINKFFVVGFLLAVNYLNASCNDAEKFVKDAVNDVRSISTTDKNRFASALTKYFDISLLAKLVLPRDAVKTFSEKHHNNFRQALKQRLIRVYATENKIKTFHDMQLEPINLKRCRVSGSKVTMKTVFKNTRTNVKTPVDWQLSHEGATFKVVDIKIEGISQKRTLKDEIKTLWTKAKNSVEAFISSI